ncbi:MAG TPA: gamma-glutamyltransferase [Alphaproteobacteria bacterium]|nr:gamma-glutamyltransferase [Alphaproteobacteria bacterium]
MHPIIRHLWRPRRRVVLAAMVLMAASFAGDMAGVARADEMRKSGFARQQMVAAAHPLAAAAGRDILRAGGSAMDAAIAVQLVLSLVEPQSSGIGGGAYLLYWDAGLAHLYAYDGRETAPASATPDLFLGPDGSSMAFMDAMVGPRAVGVPGVMAMLAKAHARHGKLPWPALFGDAIRLAETGFAVTPRLHRMIARMPRLWQLPGARALYFLDMPQSPGAAPPAQPVPLPVGSTLKNPAYAQTLRLLARDGIAPFYEGTIAAEIAAAVRQASDDGAVYLTRADLAGYRPLERQAICRPYRAYRVCGMPPSTSGGLTVLQILGLLEPVDMAAFAPGSVDAVHYISEASRLAYADRDRYIADPAFVDVPVTGMLDSGYLARRTQLIRRDRTLGIAGAGHPPGVQGSPHAPNMAVDHPSTTHFSIVDRWGNAVSMTSSVEAPFGSHLVAGGFILNNQLTDFSFVAEADGRPVANAVAPGKRPRSSMSPMVIFGPDGKLFAVVGSPGGSRIIAYVAQTVVALIDWQMAMPAAIALPRHVNRNGVLELEAGTALTALAEPLRARGHEVVIGPITSGLHGIRAVAGGYEGGADPRREGIVLGD